MPLVMGITGPIGTGKSFLAHLFEQKGWAVLDVDLVGKVVLQDPDVISRLSGLFGPDILDHTGYVVPSQLGKKVFSNERALNELNNVMHPKILSLVQERIENETKNLLIHAALLFQVGLDTLCQLIIALKVDEELIVERVSKRSSYLTEQMIRNILVEQKKYNDFWDCSDIIIDNNKTLKELKRKFERLYSHLKEG